MNLELRCSELKEDFGIDGWVVYGKGETNLGDEWFYLDNRFKGKYNKLFSSPLRKFFKDVFLPQGFPDSVHADYVPYQIWDTVQAFASTILGTLTTHSIMRGVGVGESTATPLAAAITWILKDGTGMIGRIVFAWWNGPELDAQCKKWRLFADVLNDIAMGIELSLPYFSSHSTIVLCISSVMKSLVGVAGGATRAAITQHQALNNNLADVSAKDGSQETCVNLIASLVGIFILSYLNASSFVEVYYAVLVAVHIFANYSAVRSLRFDTLNEDRLALVVKNYLTRSVILSPDEINQRESVLLFRRPTKQLCGFNIVMGGSLDKFMKILETNSDTSWSTARILNAYRQKKIGPIHRKDGLPFGMIFGEAGTMTIYVALDQGVKSSDIIDLYFKASLMAIVTSIQMNLRPDLLRESKMTVGPLSMLCKNSRSLKETEAIIDEQVGKWSKLLQNSEWVTEKNLLPVGPYRSYWDTRFLFNNFKDK